MQGGCRCGNVSRHAVLENHFQQQLGSLHRHVRAQRFICCVHRERSLNIEEEGTMQVRSKQMQVREGPLPVLTDVPGTDRELEFHALSLASSPHRLGLDTFAALHGSMCEGGSKCRMGGRLDLLGLVRAIWQVELISASVKGGTARCFFWQTSQLFLRIPPFIRRSYISFDYSELLIAEPRLQPILVTVQQLYIF
ncbi:nonribosomal siderophore peptide synthase SidC [Pseudozyma hubeiensis SY62]|uniref:Nonribosomal siderophore peptide synthase SidC n=1 Tax=Pseudozyma hubeiensis (strain SY62) TaxID=1305764 RepID=R9PKP0_PSEHS|nr:nonribosomal siderophore peptide synthase SidC [Pseudozyma hubeiensis SY62]GAC98685.1 nonribosomal siderophore peptide synthase SidC [Pseudozyma hubeiensis SY62]